LGAGNDASEPSAPQILPSGSGCCRERDDDGQQLGFGAAGACCPREGPAGLLGMDQKELDDAYDQRVYAPNMQQVLTRGERNSELVRARLGAPKRLTYGPTPIEALDLYAAKAANAPINVFVHGGAWRVGLEYRAFTF
jgi:acetyl esterase/lipase